MKRSAKPFNMSDIYVDIQRPGWEMKQNSNMYSVLIYFRADSLTF